MIKAVVTKMRRSVGTVRTSTWKVPPQPVQELVGKVLMSCTGKR